MGNENICKIQDRLAKEGLAAVVLNSTENVTYTAGYEVPSQAFPIRERIMSCVIPASGKTIMLTSDMEYSLAKAQSCLDEVRQYDEFTQDPMEVLKEILEEIGIANGVLAVEEDFLPAQHYNHLIHIMKKTKFTPARAIMSDLRAVKTDGELDKLRTVNKVAELAHHFAAEKCQAGDTELQYARCLTEYLYSNGTETITRLVVGAGERSEFGNANPTIRKMNHGEIVRADIFAKMGGYLSDVARTLVVGEPNQIQKDNWKKVIDSHHLVLGMIRAGASTRNIYEAFNKFFVKVGLDPINFVGHGLGVTLHEEPYISKFHDTELKAGMVLAIEPIYFPKGEGYQVEDIVIVTPTGYELVTNGVSTSNLIIIGNN